jgi:hypothetical protein
MLGLAFAPMARAVIAALALLTSCSRTRVQQSESRPEAGVLASSLLDEFASSYPLDATPNTIVNI